MRKPEIFRNSLVSLALLTMAIALPLFFAGCSGTNNAPFRFWPHRTVAFHTISVREGIAPLSVEFDLWISNNKPNTEFVKTIQIDFGDGAGFENIPIIGTYTISDYSHKLIRSFESPGEFRPKLKVTFDDGDVHIAEILGSAPVTVLPAEEP